MGNLNLSGPLNLLGTLDLKDKVLVSNVEALVEADNTGTAPPVILPPPPAGPSNPAPQVSIVTSFNKTITANGKAIVAQGLVMQGSPKQWPGMVLPSTANTGPSAVNANGLPINVVGDQAIVFPSGGSASFSQSGQ
jgi:hypothetical protein